MIIFLQNAWSPVYAGTVWPRRSWLRALARSRSGQRLRILNEDWDVYHNVAPVCGATPSSVMEVDAMHISGLLDKHQPNVVVACGLHAETAMRKLWSGPLLCLPHPAHRVLTNALYERARSMLDAGFTEQCALRQARGGVVHEDLTKGGADGARAKASVRA